VSVRTLAKKSVLDAYRSRSLLVGVGGFVLLFGIVGYFEANGYEPRLVGGALVSAALFLVPLACLPLAATAVSGGRGDGSLRLVLAYPHSRDHVVLGTALGRTAVLCAALCSGVVVAVTTFLAGGGGASNVGPLAPFLGVAVAYTATLACLTVGLSALTSTANRGIAATLGAYVLLGVGWGEIVRRILSARNGFRRPRYPYPEWAQAAMELTPFRAYENLTVEFTAAAAYAPTETLYRSDPFALVVLTFWLALPLLVGVVRFRTAAL
jgi:ABC-2 type transport system permease protein